MDPIQCSRSRRGLRGRRLIGLETRLAEIVIAALGISTHLFSNFTLYSFPKSKSK